jgi:hypothetical protein
MDTVATTASIRPTVRTARNQPTLCLERLINLWHLTSLDAPTVAVTWSLAFASVFQIHLPAWPLIALACLAWSAYIADRLLDTHRAQQQSLQHGGYGLRPVHQTSPVLWALAPEGNSRSLFPIPNSLSLRPRHLFHWRHRHIFVPIAITSALTALTLVLINMPPAARTRGSVLAVAALAYFTSVHNPWHLPVPKLRIPKELLVALIFTIACTLPTWARMPAHYIELLLPALSLIALAWLNCQAIEIWESRSARQRKAPILPLAASLTIFTLLAAILLAGHHPRLAVLETTAALSAALTAILDHQQHRLNPTTLRALADLVLLTPLALLIPTALGH